MLALKIISGGQTGVDQAALDAAMSLGVEYGGMLPKGRMTEAGPLSSTYAKCVEDPTADYAQRTERNVQDADVTVVFTRGILEGGTLYTVDMIRKHHKPMLQIDLLKSESEVQVQKILDFIRKHKPKVVNVAGPRASKQPDIYEEVYTVLRRVLITLQE